MLHRRGPEAVVGTWKNTAGAVWTIRSDGTFVVDLNADNRPDVTGKYSISGDVITLKATGTLPRSCREKAEYRFERAEDSLRFTLLNDRCNLRKKQLLLPWRSIQP